MWHTSHLEKVNISPASMRVIKLLVGNSPKSVADLIREMKVTRTAVTEQLNELVAAGLVERQMQRLPGRGRPRHVYSATPAALALLFARNQELVLPAIWRAIRQIGGEELVRQVVDRVSRDLANHYMRRITGEKPEDRLRQLVNILHEEGVLAEVQEEEDGKIYLRQRSCPYVIMFEENRTACLLDQEIISEVLGVPIRQVACRHDGAPCCVFEIEKGRPQKERDFISRDRYN
ncbi:MarR family transcriptional regulator [Thermogutta sp.]|jgi:predicted ArsR family transcriptional regulator|uniref:helix-turn-helix transcriptional regulator n=3 Tax=Thermogutta sp. TaxID=1962930 RepID=UPI00322013F9